MTGRVGKGSPSGSPVRPNPGGGVCTIPLEANPPRPVTRAGAGTLPIIRREPIANQQEFRRFACDVRIENPDTPDLVEADVELTRKVFGSGRLRLPDGEEVRMFGFEDPDGDEQKPFPSALIRVTEGQIVHTIIKASKGSHTIHHHGIEPTAHNDGVGHASFEVTGHYTYQWRPAHAGTYLYHCHKNTVLHFEMGMYGGLIVDPPEGEGFVRRATEVIAYDHERLWAADEIDPAWHTLHHNAGLACDLDPSEGSELSQFDPRYFVITGVGDPETLSDPRVAVEASVGDTILLRLMNGGYTVQTFTIEGLDAEVIAVDGRTLGGSGHTKYSRPFDLPAGTPTSLTTAQRRDLLVRPRVKGSFPVRVDYVSWVTGERLGRAATLINVS